MATSTLQVMIFAITLLLLSNYFLYVRVDISLQIKGTILVTINIIKVKLFYCRTCGPALKVLFNSPMLQNFINNVPVQRTLFMKEIYQPGSLESMYNTIIIGKTHP